VIGSIGPSLAIQQAMVFGSVSPHIQCLDMLNLEWQPNDDQASEPVMMLEVWDTGAILHGGSAIPVGAPVILVVDNGKVPGHVVECGKDNDFGFLVEVGIDAPERGIRALTALHGSWGRKAIQRFPTSRIQPDY